MLMASFPNSAHRQSGFSMIEVLVTLIILLVGLLGLAGLMVQSQRSEMESYQRVQALILLQDMAGRLNANRKVASCYAFTANAAAGTPYLGVAGATPVAVPACAAGTAAQNAQAIQDMTDWDDMLTGVAETSAGASVGAMVGARGCVSYDAATELLDKNGLTIAGTGIYTIAVAWQGMASTAIATPNCAQGEYGSEAQRRVVSLTLRTASLTTP
jgi:type IV pilus assembly protein PilV